jgi:predicted short-subunit dehydrogenase-like oxidoreductase (DUF2520 family)
MTRHQPLPNAAIIGPGRIGQAMGHLLSQSGISVALIGGRRPAAVRRAVRFIGMGIPTSLSDPRISSVSVVLIATSDAAVAGVARQLARLGDGRDAWRGRVVLHICGSLPSAVLAPLRLRGAAVGSIHPFQTVPSPQAGVRSLRGCYWAIEGDPPALRVARGWIKRLEGIAFTIPAGAKPLYHLSAFMACPTVVTLMAQSARLLTQAGVPERISRPMLRQFVAETARNFAALGPRQALTGPAVRGDWTTIRRHLAALRKSAPEFLPVYRSLLAAMLRLAGKGSAAPGGRKTKSKVKRQKAKVKRQN